MQGAAILCPERNTTGGSVGDQRLGNHPLDELLRLGLITEFGAAFAVIGGGGVKALLATLCPRGPTGVAILLNGVAFVGLKNLLGTVFTGEQ